MKFSIYNSLIRISEKHALFFNSYSNSFLLLNNKLYNLLNTTTDPVSLETNFHAFFSQLQKNGFIVEDELDEFVRLKKLILELDDDPHSYILTINPTLNCNFNCWYCYEEHPKDSNMSITTLNKIYKLIEKILASSDLNQFYLAFFGGEPLLKFRTIVKPLINYTRKMCEDRGIRFIVSFTTNGYLFDIDKVRFLSDLDSCYAQITLDGCREDHNSVRHLQSQNSSFDKIVKNVFLLIENNCEVILRVNYTCENIDRLIEILPSFTPIKEELKGRIEFDFHQVWQDKHKGGDLSDKLTYIRATFRNSGFKVTHASQHRIFNSCYADKENGCVINFNGDVFRCTAKDFCTFPRDGFLNDNGVVEWENNSDIIRKNAKLHNKFCQTCRIAPLCGGGCSQYSVDNLHREYCICNFNEEEKNKTILAHMENTIINNNPN